MVEEIERAVAQRVSDGSGWSRLSEKNQDAKRDGAENFKHLLTACGPYGFEPESICRGDAAGGNESKDGLLSITHDYLTKF
jgi:hypothetical protein